MSKRFVGMEKGLLIIKEYRSVSSGRIKLAQASVLDFEGDAIVNAANVRGHGIGSGGVDGAITNAGGDELVRARLALPILDLSTKTRIPWGDARTTRAFGSIKSDFVIHAVSGDFRGARTRSQVREIEQLVKDAYRAALREASVHGCSSVAFSLLSAGIFRGDLSLERVLSLGAETLVQCIPQGQTVYMCAFSDEELETLEMVLDSLAAT